MGLKKIWLILSVLISCLWTALIPISVRASNGISIDEIYVWRNALQTEDMLFVIRYDIPYATPPDSDVSETFVFRIMDYNTNAIEKGAVSAYPYATNGYNKGIVSWYFPSGSGMVWNQAYFIRIEGKTTYFDAPVPFYWYQIPLTAFSSYTTTSDIQTDITAKVISFAQTLNSAWSASTSLVPLTTTLESSTVLSASGENYFRNAIPGIQAMCPSLFQLQITDPTYPTTSWSTSQATTYEQTYSGTEIGGGIQGFATLFTMSYHVIALIPLLIVCVILLVVGATQESVLSGLMGSAYIYIIGSAEGFAPMAMMAIITLACTIFLGYHLIWKSTF